MNSYRDEAEKVIEGRVKIGMMVGDGTRDTGCKDKKGRRQGSGNAIVNEYNIPSALPVNCQTRFPTRSQEAMS